jgi:YVTN family beta-propeller protein
LTPADLRLSPDGRRLYIVCEGNDSVLAVDSRTRRVVATAHVGSKPKGIALSPDGRTLYVSNESSDTVSEIDAGTFQVNRTLKTGWGPAGLATDRTGRHLYVANSIANSISVIDLTSGKELKRLAANRSPHYVTASRDGRRIYVSNLLPHLGPYDQPSVSELTVVATADQVVTERIPIPGVIELRHIAEAPAAQGSYLIVPFLRPKNLDPLIRVEQGWVVTHGMAVVRPVRGRVPFEKRSSVAQVLLDDIDAYFADGFGSAVTPDGRLALVTASGANLVSVIDTARLTRLLRQAPADGLPDRLDAARKFVVRRLPTGDDPRAVVVSPDGRWAYIANRLGDSVTVLDLARLKVASTIDLGGPKEISMLRRGEQLFHDARYCLQGQFACATCHPDDHVDGLAWNLETPQLGRDRVDNRTLRGIAETAPYKWSGHNPDLITQCGPRIAKFLFRSEGFNTEELQSLVAFLRSIPLPPNRHLAKESELTDAQDRGRRIYFRTRTNDGKPIPVQNQCATCHPADTHYTNRISADVGSANKYDTLGMFDVPQLDRVYESAPYLHNGEALTLEEIWTVYNNQDTHGVTSDMRKEQLNELIEYLKTL